jgi:hypothetical protein
MDLTTRPAQLGEGCVRRRRPIGGVHEHHQDVARARVTHTRHEAPLAAHNATTLGVAVAEDWIARIRSSPPPGAVQKRYGEEDNGWLGAIVTYYRFIVPLLPRPVTAPSRATSTSSHPRRPGRAIGDQSPCRGGCALACSRLVW